MAGMVTAAVVVPFLIVMLCFCIFLCAMWYRGGARGAGMWLLFGGAGGGADAVWCYQGSLGNKSMAKLPCREVGEGEALECVICITELAAGETARVLPRCGHEFHVDCFDMWLNTHSTCPLCRGAAGDDDDPHVPPAVPIPEVAPEPPNFPTDLLFFGSHDEVRTQNLSLAIAAASLHGAFSAPQEGHGVNSRCRQAGCGD